MDPSNTDGLREGGLRAAHPPRPRACPTSEDGRSPALFLSPIADGGVRPQGGRGPSGAAGRKPRSVRASSALSRGPSGAARHLPAAARQGGGVRGHVKDLTLPRVAHAPCLAGPGVRRAGRWRGARAGGPGTVGCVGVSAPDAWNAPRSRLDGGPCQRGLSPLCRMPYATPGARHACAPGSPDAHPAGAGASDAPADPAVFFSPQANTRPTHPRGRLGRGSKTPSPRRGVETHYAPGRKGRVQLRVRRRLIRCGASVWMLRGGCVSALVAPGTAGGRRPRAPAPPSRRCGGLLRVGTRPRC